MEKVSMKSRFSDVKEIDALFTQLSAEFNIPKPNYCIHEVKCVKKLEPFKTKLKAIMFRSDRGISFMFNTTFIIPLGVFITPFNRRGKMCYISVILRSKRGIGRKSLVHEFFHYLRYVKNGYKFTGLGEEEEKQTRRETWEYLRRPLEKEEE